MRINGRWLQCEDGVIRPVLSGTILRADQSWWPVEFLLDTGAEQTVLNAAILQALHMPTDESPLRLSGVGGIVESVIVKTAVRFARDDGQKVTFRGQYAAFPDPEALDMSVLGRDILDLFALIVDRPGDVVCLLGQRHHYIIQQTP